MRLYKVLFFLLVSLIGNKCIGQSWQWAIKDSGIGGYGQAICTDSAGNSYITGNILKGVYFNSCGTISTGFLNVFVAKYDNSGNCVWVKDAGGTASSGVGGSGIAVDKHGNIFVTGGSSDSIFFGAFHLGGGLFLAKYDNNGNVIWAKGCLGGGQAISLDNDGNIYLTGGASGNLGGCVMTDYMLIVKLDSNGNCVWTAGNEGKGIDGGWDIKTDSVGNSYIIGFYSDTAFLGNDTLIPNIHGHTQAFITKFDNNGNCLWAKTPWDTGGAFYLASIGIDKWGKLYVSSSTHGAIYFGCDTFYVGSNSSFISKFDTYGNCVWDKPINNAGGLIHVDKIGTCYLEGYFSSSTSIGSCTLSGIGLFITALDSAGNCQWVQTANGNADPYGIDCDWYGNCYIVSALFGNTIFGSITVTSPINPASISVAKLSAPSGISTISNNQSAIKIFPNPSTGSFTLSLSNVSEKCNVEIYNVMGERIFAEILAPSTRGQGDNLIELSNQPNGVYLYRVLKEDGGLVGSGKMVIEK